MWSISTSAPFSSTEIVKMFEMPAQPEACLVNGLVLGLRRIASATPGEAIERSDEGRGIQAQRTILAIGVVGA